MGSGQKRLMNIREDRQGRMKAKPSQAESPSASLTSVAFLQLFAQSWKCDILKLVFIETNVRRGDSS